MQTEGLFNAPNCNPPVFLLRKNPAPFTQGGLFGAEISLKQFPFAVCNTGGDQGLIKTNKIATQTGGDFIAFISCGDTASFGQSDQEDNLR